ncbi:tRNA (adenosine(37)-N6)-threonylcarbamoyltransferase complex ATPase subunit type 1 TsaE [Corynebacterium sp. sy017]|uniref:tRNA (adenosine(37)-N6)-threonylcarbamoyltransferase complex ATPase subunit type 1 TsaE n=1 Tax=unclassified Corynebacterium TaxID=2624378 RepID=UPI0011853856|nr:tRNA (adenosine(37)-N6)-threonylcarbamoyltransferase complex ATPase subunit type 1 TsaE [Corynebacterium sp. SY003]MBP3088662.1 tRNA (adenosine(37)-N6)-threonylcarbamoyltransferase complex ATPase subunit type 1 TsaE [Corynebacterium sp. sy017]TSD91953.1 tRNA (adenosine(37)-N6)-threonylcarbamoyltransferase complex ATPase subunit type 1 TsaE [Corynebacterium sp. SY003]
MHDFPLSGRRRLETVSDTQDFAEELGKHLEAGDVVILSGPVGAGKTTFTQGLARGLGVKGRVTSPTFIIAREHASLSDGPALIHVDAYRLIDGEAGNAVGMLDSLDLETELEQAVVVAEWGGGLIERIAENYLVIEFDRRTAWEQDAQSQARILSWQWVEGT